jgi:hypothetical protein
VTEFIDGLHYGDERFFLYNGNKYFIQGYTENAKPLLVLYILEDPNNDFKWQAISTDKNFPVADFENAAIFNGKTFWEVEKDIEWVDC